MAGSERVICSSADLTDSGDGVRFELEVEGRPEPAFAVRYRGRVYASSSKRTPSPESVRSALEQITRSEPAIALAHRCFPNKRGVRVPPGRPWDAPRDSPRRPALRLLPPSGDHAPCLRS